MKKLCIQVCEKALLTIEVTPEMEIDFFRVLGYGRARGGV